MSTFPKSVPVLRCLLMTNRVSEKQVEDWEKNYWINQTIKGITCMPDSEVSMVSSGISPALLELKLLTYLDLSGNDFSGSHIPEFIGSLTHLRLNTWTFLIRASQENCPDGCGTQALFKDYIFLAIDLQDPCRNI